MNASIRRFGLGLAATFLLALLVGPAAGEEAEFEFPRDSELSKRHFEDGVLCAEEHKWSEGATAFWKAVEADLLNYHAHVRYQECALRAGDDATVLLVDYGRFCEEHPGRLVLRLHRLRLDAAAQRLVELDKLAKQHSKDSDAWLEVGRAQLALGQPALAAAALEKAFALRSADRPDVLLLLAEAQHRAEKTVAAIQLLEGAVRADAEFFAGRFLLARLLLAKAEAAKCLEHATIVTEQRPSFVAALLLRGEALVALGKDDEARAAFESAYRVNKDIDDVVIALADVTARQETEIAWKQSLAYYDEVLARSPESWRSHFGKGWVLERMEQHPEAEASYREVVALRPTSAEAVNSVGYSLFKQGRVSEAQVQFKRAVDMRPTFVTALANLGSTYDAQAKYSDAIKIYEKILDMKGQDKNLRALINCAFDHESVGAFSKALKLLLRAHEILPKDANIVVWIGDNAYFQKRWPEAEKWFQQAVALDEKNFFAWRGLGLALAQRKRWADAAQALEKACQIDPEDLDLYVSIGDIYYTELKDLEKALAKYQEYVQRGGNDPEVSDAILEIRKALEKKR